MRHIKLVVVLSAVAVAVAPMRARTQEQWPPETAPASYIPTVGDIMGQTQLRHFKLGFSGSAGNWELANYELGQITQSFNAIAKLYPKLGDVDFAQLILNESAPSLAAISKAISAKSGRDFEKSFEQLTTACNSCHVAAHVGFIKIRVPTTSPFSDQIFPPQSR
jgi:hypothetical protein